MKDIVPFRRRRNGLFPSDIFRDFFGRDWIDDFLSNSLVSAGFGGGFRADIKETDKEYIVEAELPGFNKEDIEIELLDDRLTISARQNEEYKEERDNYLRRERRFGEVCRSFIVSGIRNEEVNAEYKNGILKVILPKSEEGRQRIRRIDIQ